MKRVFGYAEVIFDILYLLAACTIGCILLLTGPSSTKQLAGIMALVLAGGDAFHLVPRILTIVTGQEERYRKGMGIGKMITSITMTVFYILLWNIGVLLFQPGETAKAWTAVVYILAAVRIGLCFLPQNRWCEITPPVNWGIIRNIPFTLQGIAVILLFAACGSGFQGVRLIWPAVFLSFLFYLPVVIGANNNPRLGMLMLPKSLAYLWILSMTFYL